MTTLLYRIGATAARHPWRYVGGWVLAAVLAATLATTAGGTLIDDYTIPDTDSQRAADLLEERFPEQAGSSARIVIAAGAGETVPTSVLDEVSAAVATLPHVEAVEPAVPSQDGRVAIVGVRYDAPVTDVEPLVATDLLHEAAEPARDAGLQAELGGEVPDQSYEQGASELIGFGLAAIILLVAFGSVIAAGLPLAMAAMGLGIGMSLVTLLAAVVKISTITPTLAAMVGIGVGIDYALLVVARHRQQLLAGVSMRESIAMANATAGRSVFFAGTTVLVAICGLAFSGVPNFVLMGVATAIVVAVSMLAAVTLLPALLALAKHRVLGRRTRRALSDGTLQLAEPKPSLAGRWAGHASRHPVRYLLGSLIVLVTLAAPVTALELGQSDAGSEPTSSTTRRAYDIVSDAYGPGANGPLVVVADLRAADAPDPAALAGQLGAVEGVVAVQPPLLNAAGDAAVISVVPTTGPQDDATDNLVRTLRNDVLPDSSSVTGPTAGFMDFNQRLQDTLPIVIGVVVGASVLLLVFVFRSVVAPVKAAVMNLLSIGAAYGAIVALFQWGWGTSLFGLEQAVPINAFVPVFMFAILFGLSMDYEVFLLSRIREEWERTGDTRRSVVDGVGSTGRVITSAALIMVAVFAGFALDDFVAVKMMGVGMAVAVLVDATLVRLVLVPSTMVLLGRYNWWLPRWLDRLLPRTMLHLPEANVPAPRAPAREPVETVR